MSYNANQYLPGVIQIPSTLEITAITRSQQMQVTVSVDPVTASNTYIAGQLVKLVIPYGYGMQQANGMIGQVVSRVGSVITLNIDSTNFDPFSVPASGQKPASLAPYGSRNLSLNNDSYQEPFQSLNNIGN